MHNDRRADLAARLVLTLAALLPYWRVLTLGVVFVTDDYFASDIFNGELPFRVLIGGMIRHGRMPVWTDRLCSGFPLVGTALDPVGLAPFALLPPAPALDVLVIVLLLIAAHGAYSLARRFGADRIGSVLAGIAFAGSGYIACQLKHLGIVSTVVWLPLGLVMLDRAMESRRTWTAAGFGLLFANQALCGFPQSAYISGLVYVAFALFRGVSRQEKELRVAWHPLARAGAAMALGAAAGAVVLLPLSSLGAISDRVDMTSWAWSSRFAYWPVNAIQFLVPYANGDISNNTYTGPPFFWEDYGYVGLATFLLAVYGGIRERRRRVVAFSICMTLLAYLLVLGPRTPVFRVAFLLIPGISMFRFPTRFLILVELGLAVLGAIGLTRLRHDLPRGTRSSARVATLVCAGICAATAIDLFVHQPRQNPMVSARDWLAPPETVGGITADTSEPRTFSPRHRDLHLATFQAAHGWADVAPYFAMRDLLEPNLGGGLWNVPSADCYAGITPRWYVDVWGDNTRELSLMGLMAAYDTRGQVLKMHPHMPALLRGYGVTHVLSRFPVQGAVLGPPARRADTYVYRVDGAFQAWFVGASRRLNDADAAKRLLDPGFDPMREVLLADVPDTDVLPATLPAADGDPVVSAAVNTTGDPREINIDARAPRDGFVVLADTYFPGWSAEVDGRPVETYRANLSVRAIPVTRGRHQIHLKYEPPGWRTGLVISVCAIAVLVLWFSYELTTSGTFGRSRRQGR
jgi:hypothetical protein